MRWGTELFANRGRCNTGSCTFTWDRDDDWRFFVKKKSREPFASREHYEGAL